MPAAQHFVVDFVADWLMVMNADRYGLRNLAKPKHPWHGERPRDSSPMSWSELERFVDDVEADCALQHALKHCRSRDELILGAWRLGYRITRMNLQRA